MTASRTPAERNSLVSPVVDYEPPPVGVSPTLNGKTAPCPPPTPAALRRRTVRPSPCPSGGRVPSLRGEYPQRLKSRAAVRDAAPPHAAVVFADTALRRVLEVIDRRRPVAQLRRLLAPTLIDTVIGMTRSSHTAAATLRRVRLRMVGGDAAEVFGTFTRGPRVHAIAARIALSGDGWRIVALQIG